MKEKITEIVKRYEEIHPRPASHKESVAYLTSLYDGFATQDGYDPLTESERQGLGEYYRMYLNTGEVFYILIEAIYRHRKKGPEKRYFRYLIGILKNWRSFGVGNDPTSEQRRLAEFFEKLGIHLSPEQNDELSGYLTKYGPFAVGIAAGRLANRNYAEMILEEFRMQFPNEEASPSESVEIMDKPLEELDNPMIETILESEWLEDVLRKNGVLSFKEIKVKMTGAYPISREKLSRQFHLYLRANPKIVRVGKTKYAAV